MHRLLVAEMCSSPPVSILEWLGVEGRVDAHQAQPTSTSYDVTLPGSLCGPQILTITDGSRLSCDFPTLVSLVAFPRDKQQANPSMLILGRRSRRGRQ